MGVDVLHLWDIPSRGYINAYKHNLGRVVTSWRIDTGAGGDPVLWL